MESGNIRHFEKKTTLFGPISSGITPTEIQRQASI
jgi:hypothetical protein